MISSISRFSKSIFPPSSISRFRFSWCFHPARLPSFKRDSQSPSVLLNRPGRPWPKPIGYWSFSFYGISCLPVKRCIYSDDRFLIRLNPCCPPHRRMCRQAPGRSFSWKRRWGLHRRSPARFTCFHLHQAVRQPPLPEKSSPIES